MQKLDRTTLHSLEEYATLRDEFRREVIEHKKPRRIAVTPNAVLYFEDFTTMKYQVQEMLRAERIFEADGIQEEIDAYNPLIPDGSNWKATFMLEYPDVDERRARLAELVGIEDRVYVRVGELERVYAISDEDLERSTEEKTSSVHFSRFELTPEMIAAAKGGAAIHIGIEHENLTAEVELSPASRDSLTADLELPH
ncbi:MAG: DUF3501 family protein [Pseudomonadales bacterium]|jgi:hypothetical protein|nr:DUF3501 family protein [Pseudomonadales bacterium]